MTDLLIVNGALAHLGSLPATTMADTTKNQAAAIAAYPTARDSILRMFPWSCVMKREALLDTAVAICQWVLSHTYHVGDKCTNDTGKVYECITAGVSAGAGGPTGVTANITDGTAHWKYVIADDTTTNWAWRPSITWVVGDTVANDDGKVYVCITAGAGAVAAPGPAGTSADITDNAAHWKYWGTIPDNLTTFAYLYVYPWDCLRLHRLCTPYETDEKGPGQQYLLERRFIYTDLGDAVGKYVHKCTASTDPDLWDVLLQDAIMLRIATSIALLVTGKPEMLQAMVTLFTAVHGEAKGATALEGTSAPDEPESWSD
jgi:hypothetical protein